MPVKPFVLTRGISWTKETEPFSDRLAYAHNLQWDGNAVSARGGSVKILDLAKEPFADLTYAGYLKISDIWEYNGELYVGTVIPSDHDVIIERDSVDTRPYRSNVAIWKVVKNSSSSSTGWQLQRVFWHTFISPVLNYWTFDFKRFTPENIRFWRGINIEGRRLIFTGSNDFFLQKPDGTIHKYISEAPPCNGQLALYLDITKIALGDEPLYPTDGIPADKWVFSEDPTVRSNCMHFLQNNNSAHASYYKRHIWDRNKFYRQDWFMIGHDDTATKHGYYDEYESHRSHRVERATLKRVVDQSEYDVVSNLVTIDNDNGIYEKGKPENPFISEYRITISNSVSESAPCPTFGSNNYVTSSKARLFFDPRVKHHFKREKGKTVNDDLYWNLDDNLSRLKTYPLAFSKAISKSYPTDSAASQKAEIIQTADGKSSVTVYAPYGANSFKVGKTYEVWRPHRRQWWAEYINCNAYVYSRIDDGAGSTSFELDSITDLGNNRVKLTFTTDFAATLLSDPLEWCINDNGDITCYPKITEYRNSKEEHFYYSGNREVATADLDIPRCGFLQAVFRTTDATDLPDYNNPGYIGAIAGRYNFEVREGYASTSYPYIQSDYYLAFPRTLAEIPIMDEGYLTRNEFYTADNIFVHGALVVFEAEDVFEDIEMGESTALGFNSTTNDFEMISPIGVGAETKILSDYGVLTEDIAEELIGEVWSYRAFWRNFSEIALSMVRRFRYYGMDNYDEVIGLVKSANLEPQNGTEFFKWIAANADIDATDVEDPIASFKVNLYRRAADGNFVKLETKEYNWHLAGWTDQSLLPSPTVFPVIWFEDVGKELTSSRVLNEEDRIMPAFEGAIYWDDRLVAWEKHRIWWTERGKYTNFSPLRSYNMPNSKTVNQVAIIGGLEYVTGKSASLAVLQDDNVWMFTLDDNGLPLTHMLSQDIGGQQGVVYQGNYYFVGRNGMFMLNPKAALIQSFNQWIDGENWLKHLSLANWKSSRIFALDNKIILSLNLALFPLVGDQTLALAPEVLNKAGTDEEGRYAQLQSHFKGADNRNLELVFDLQKGTCGTRQWHIDYYCHNETAIPEGYSYIPLEADFKLSVGADTFTLDGDKNLMAVINTFDEFSWWDIAHTKKFSDYRNNGCLLLHSPDFPARDSMAIKYDTTGLWIYGCIVPTSGNAIEAYLESHRMPLSHSVFKDPASEAWQLWLLTDNQPKKLGYRLYGMHELGFDNKPLPVSLIDYSLDDDGLPPIITWDKLRTLSENGEYLEGKWQILNGLRRFDRIALPTDINSPYFRLRLDWRVENYNNLTGLLETDTSKKLVYLILLETT